MALETIKREVTKKFLGTPTYEEKRVALVGTQGSGKTTALTFLHLTCINLANDPKNNFLYHPKEGRTGIREAQSKLRSGMFPERTPEKLVFEATLLMKWRTMAGVKEVRVPICETAGEEIAKFIDRFSAGQYDLNPTDFRHASELHSYILQSSGFMVVTPISRAAITGGKRIEREPNGLSKDPDVNIARLLECVHDYKERTGSPPIKAIAVLMTKYDLLSRIVEAKGMDLMQKEGLQKFMRAYFPETFNILNFYGIDKVSFFPSWVELATDQKGNLIPYTNENNQTNYKIRVNEDRRIPIYPEQNYISLVSWIKQNFAS